VRNTQGVVHDDLAQVVEATFHLLEPYRRARQSIGSPDVEHDEAVEVTNGRVRVDVGRQTVCVARHHAAVAADVYVPPFFGGDKPEVFALDLGALAHAAAYRALHLVRRANPLVTMLNSDGHRRRVLHA